MQLRLKVDDMQHHQASDNLQRRRQWTGPYRANRRVDNFRGLSQLE